MILEKLAEQALCHPPAFVVSTCQYLTIMGSMAYGVESKSSDIDVYGFCTPPRDMLFPHLAGEVLGFGRQTPRFEQWQQHHVKGLNGVTEYDFSVYSIVKFVQLCMDNNPNMIDSLFTAERCVLHARPAALHLREHRREFLHKGAFPKFKNYSYDQMQRYVLKAKPAVIALRQFERDNLLEPLTDPANLTRELNNRLHPSTMDASLGPTDYETFSMELLRQYGELVAKLSKRELKNLVQNYDVKAMYHVVRLLNEVEQIMVEHDLDLERNREQLKSIRRGEWDLEQIETYFHTKELALETVYASSTLRPVANEGRIKQLLLECLEMEYGKLDAVVTIKPSIEYLIADMRALVDRYAGAGA